MSGIRVEERVSAMQRWITALLALGVLLVAQSGEAADGIKFFKNYFVTGDYVAGWVDLQPQQPVAGRVSGDIPMSGVPADADILAAFLYWETVTTGVPDAISAKFRDDEIGSFAVRVGQSPLNPSTAPCWAKQSGGNSIVTTWRVDVLRSLPLGTNANAPNFRKRLVNDADLTAQGEGPHRVYLPDSGTGNQLPESSGASLVVIYRHTDLPLTGIVLYEGFHHSPSSATMSQTLRGFFERAPSAVGRLTMHVGSGQPNPSEQVSFNGELQTSVVNPFNSSPSSQRGWRSLTLTGLGMGGTGETSTYGEEVTTAVTHTDPTEECLSWTAFQFSVPVLDEDRDGLLNVWESPDVASLRDPDETPLPNLYNMRARPNVQDIFVEVGFMTAPNGTRYGPLDGMGQCVAPVCEQETRPGGHSHLPMKDALDLVATAFRNAYSPRAGNISGPINIHFDVGNNYQSGLPSNQTCLTGTWVPSCAIIPWSANAASNLARGGDVVPETACAPSPSCDFSDHPGTVGWKIDYRLIREQPLNYSDEVECAQATDCVRRFDHNRRYTHRYALFAHALGLPVAMTDDPNTPYDDRHTPTRASGIADFPGGDLMVTLGRWDDFTGSFFVQASTLMHEFGHTAKLKHGGIAGQPNCKPNYETVMNYLFQVRGLFTISGNTISDPIVDYSRQTLPLLNEPSLNEPTGLGSMTYATRWFAPWGNSLIDTSLVTSPAKRHCDGSPLSSAELADALATPPGPLAMARVDGSTMSGPIDWNADGTADDSGFGQDISFSGSQISLDAGVNDWTLLDLRQVGSRRNVASLNAAGTGLGGALSLGLNTRDFMGGFDVEFLGGFDVDFLGGFDIEFLGGYDVEFLGGYDVEFLGGFDIEFLGDAGLGEAGLGDVVPDGQNTPHADVSLETAIAYGNAPHIQQAQFNKQPNRVTLTVRRPHAGKTTSFEAYRVDGGLPVTTTAFAQRVHVGTPWPFPAGTTPTVTIEDPSAQPNRTYTYFVLAIMENPDDPANPTRSGISPYRVVVTKQ